MAFLAPEKVTDQEVSVLKLLETRDPREVQFRGVFRTKLPDNFSIRVDLDDSFLSSTTNHRVAIGEPDGLACFGYAGVFPDDVSFRINLPDGPFSFVRGNDVSIWKSVDIPDLLMEMLMACMQRGDVHDLTVGIDFERLRGALFGDQSVAIWEPLTAEYLLGFTDVLKDGFPARSDLANPGGRASVAEQKIAIWKHLKNDCRARRLEFPDKFSGGIKLHEAVWTFPVLGKNEAPLVLLSNSGGDTEKTFVQKKNRQQDNGKNASHKTGGDWRGTA